MQAAPSQHRTHARDHRYQVKSRQHTPPGSASDARTARGDRRSARSVHRQSNELQTGAPIATAAAALASHFLHVWPER
jgi:hypothetical protein